MRPFADIYGKRGDAEAGRPFQLTMEAKRAEHSVCRRVSGFRVGFFPSPGRQLWVPPAFVSTASEPRARSVAVQRFRRKWWKRGPQ